MFVHGYWWKGVESLEQISDTLFTERCGKALRTVRFKTVDRISWLLRTKASDDRVNDPDAAKCWNPPDGGGTAPDPDDAEDWLLAGARYEYDPDTGECRVTASAVRTGADWDAVATMPAYGGIL